MQPSLYILINALGHVILLLFQSIMQPYILDEFLHPKLFVTICKTVPSLWRIHAMLLYNLLKIRALKRQFNCAP